MIGGKGLLAAFEKERSRPTRHRHMKIIGTPLDGIEVVDMGNKEEIKLELNTRLLD